MSDFLYLITSLPEVVIRGIFVGLLVSVAAALLGVILVIKRYSMIGDGLSHVAFGAMSIALVLNLAPLAFAVPVVVLAAFLLLHLTRHSKVGGDSAIALVSSTSLALGVAAISLAGGVNNGVSDYMFGSIVAISKSDAFLCVPILLFVIIAFAVIRSRIFAVTFDEDFAKASGVKAKVYNTVIAILTALTVVIGMRIMGTLLISGIIIFPALSAMRVLRSFKGVIAGAALISVSCFILGSVASILLDTPVGASIVLVNAVCFCAFSIVGKAIG